MDVRVRRFSFGPGAFPPCSWHLLAYWKPGQTGPDTGQIKDMTIQWSHQFTLDGCRNALIRDGRLMSLKIKCLTRLDVTPKSWRYAPYLRYWWVLTPLRHDYYLLVYGPVGGHGGIPVTHRRNVGMRANVHPQGLSPYSYEIHAAAGSFSGSFSCAWLREQSLCSAVNDDSWVSAISPSSGVDPLRVSNACPVEESKHVYVVYFDHDLLIICVHNALQRIFLSPLRASLLLCDPRTWCLPNSQLLLCPPSQPGLLLQSRLDRRSCHCPIARSVLSSLTLILRVQDIACPVLPYRGVVEVCER